MTERTRLLIQETIRRKRDGAVLDAAELADFAQGVADGGWSDAQAAALAMAVFFRGMTADECAQLTFAMRDTGEVLGWKALGVERPILDKHSTGGVGDLVSLPLGSMLAACGAAVPMISGRGLGHTGGTLDKLESLPGYQALPDRARFVRVVKEVGVAIVGADEMLAPADRRLYAIRDVTATVDSVAMITASILSKKLAAGLEGLVLDVKTGNGAVMPELARARALAHSLVETARLAGLSVTALLTDMSQPLARSAGNALEMLESVQLLRGEACDSRLLEVTLALGAQLLVMGKLAVNEAQARQMLNKSISSGQAAERFARMVAGLGGPADVIDNVERHLPKAPVIVDVPSPSAGIVSAIDTRALGFVVVMLGGGRQLPGEALDLSVGLDRLLPAGAKVARGEPLARIHAANADAAQAATLRVQRAYTISATTPELPPLVRRLDEDVV